jgi:hypothetical protein
MMHKRLDIKPLQKDELFGSILEQRRQQQQLRDKEKEKEEEEKKEREKEKDRLRLQQQQDQEDEGQQLQESKVPKAAGKKKQQLTEAIELSQQLEPDTRTSTDKVIKTKFVQFHAVTEEDIKNAQASRLVRKYIRPSSAVNRHVSDCTCQTCALQAKVASQTQFFKIVGNDKLVQNILEMHGMRKAVDDECNLLWSNQHLRSNVFKMMKRRQRINLFPRSFECTRKDALATSLNILIEKRGKRHFPFVPERFVWPRERDAAVSAVGKLGGRPWVLKPAGSNQGNGISLITRISQLPSEGSGLNRDENWVIEKYIDNPLLLDGSKFDMKLFVCVTSFHPLKVYLHQEGFVRVDLEKYVPFARREVPRTNPSINRTKVHASRQAQERKIPSINHKTYGDMDVDDEDMLSVLCRDDDEDTDALLLGSRRPLKSSSQGIVSEASLATTVPPTTIKTDLQMEKWSLSKLNNHLEKMGVGAGRLPHCLLSF